MEGLTRCGGCGRPLAAGVVPDAPCPFCLLELGRAARRAVYRIVAPLGEGRLGPLSLASPEGEPGRRVAVKQLSPPAGARLDPDRFEEALASLMEFRHPRVIPIVDGGWLDEGRAFVVTGFLPGGSIDLFCERAAPPVAVRRRLVEAVAEAVDVAHRRGIVHGGLAASDAIVTLEAGHPVVRVRDFGLRRLTGRPAAASDDLEALERLSRRIVV